MHLGEMRCAFAMYSACVQFAAIGHQTWSWLWALASQDLVEGACDSFSRGRF